MRLAEEYGQSDLWKKYIEYFQLPLDKREVSKTQAMYSWKKAKKARSQISWIDDYF